MLTQPMAYRLGIAREFAPPVYDKGSIGHRPDWPHPHAAGYSYCRFEDCGTRAADLGYETPASLLYQHTLSFHDNLWWAKAGVAELTHYKQTCPDWYNRDVRARLLSDSDCIVGCGETPYAAIVDFDRAGEQRKIASSALGKPETSCYE